MSIFKDSDRLRWVSDGQMVTLGLDSGKGLPCRVITAAGHRALVESLGSRPHYCGWVPVTRLFPEVTQEMKDAATEI